MVEPQVEVSFYASIPASLKRLRVAIVVPALDEEAALRRLLPAALVADEVIVSDGGSRDGTVEVARSLGAKIVTGPPGRGEQLNRGAAAATADLLLFLHADTALPRDALEEIRQAVAAGALGGGFYVRFDSRRPLLRLGARFINLRTRFTRAPLGDQGQFVLRRVFREMGGFQEWPILEDLDFILRLRRRGKVAVLRGPVTTAARRFLEQGIPRTVATNWLIWSLYFLGVSPYRLARLYRHVR